MSVIKKSWHYLALLLVVVLIASFSLFSILYDIAFAIHYQSSERLQVKEIMDTVENYAGCSFVTADSSYNGLGSGTYFTACEEGSVMYKAGMRSDDKLILEAKDGVNDNARYLIMMVENQGKEVSIPVKRDGEEMEITFVVPDLGIDVEEVQAIHWEHHSKLQY